jgi:hypothetical protein
MKHPAFAQVPSFDKGAASRDFKVLILGFGGHGQQALLRLVMNGQFVGRRMKAIIVDKEMGDISGRFTRRYPALGLCCGLYYHSFDVRSADFFNLLDENGYIDYVVSVLGGEDESMQAALDVRDHYAGKDVTQPIIAAAAEDGFEERDGIVCLGSVRDIFTEPALIHDEDDLTAMAVNSVYGQKGNVTRDEIFALWQKLDWFTQESNRASADFIPAMLRLAGLSPEQAEKSDKLTGDVSLAETLAMTEHLRWMAFHASMGWRPMSVDEMERRFETLPDNEKRLTLCRKDDALKLHLCLAPWEELDDISAAYNGLIKLSGGNDMRDFKADDYKIVQNVPLFLKACKQ